MFCLYLIQHMAASKTRTFCVCPWHTRPIPTTILSYSFSHSVELPLGFTGVVLYLHFLHKMVTLTHFRYSRQYVCCTKAMSARYFDVSIRMLVCFWAYADVCMQIKQVHFTSCQKYAQLLSQSFQYLKTTCCSIALFCVCYRVVRLAS